MLSANMKRKPNIQKYEHTVKSNRTSLKLDLKKYLSRMLGMVTHNSVP